MLAKNIVNMQNYHMKSPAEKLSRPGLVDVYPRFAGSSGLMSLVDGANEMIAMPRATSEEYKVARAAAIGTAKPVYLEKH